VSGFPAATADAQAGRTTLVTLLGRKRAADLFGGVVWSAYALVLALPLFGAPLGAMLGGVGATPAMGAVAMLRAAPDDGARIASIGSWIRAAALLYAAGSGLGLFLV
jgi:1,4-dihydroxy-2-naphthoate octaprenyltransferase